VLENNIVNEEGLE